TAVLSWHLGRVALDRAAVRTRAAATDVPQRVWSAVPAGAVCDLGRGADPRLRAVALVAGHTLGPVGRTGGPGDVSVSQRDDLVHAGLGDVTPLNPAGRVLAVAQSGIGFGFLALVIGYLPVLYQAFSRREVMISLLDA